MNIPKNQVYCLTLRSPDGSDILTNEFVRFSGEPSAFVTYKGLGFKKIWESKLGVVYSQVSTSDVSSILYMKES
jgi:hypothetical protein